MYEFIYSESFRKYTQQQSSAYLMNTYKCVQAYITHLIKTIINSNMLYFSTIFNFDNIFLQKHLPRYRFIEIRHPLLVLLFFLNFEFHENALCVLPPTMKYLFTMLPNVSASQSIHQCLN